MDVWGGGGELGQGPVISHFMCYQKNKNEKIKKRTRKVPWNT